MIFHGRGGTPARGGGRTENLVESVPNGAIRGVLRLTEQGEVVNQSYGLRPIAMRTLERTFASVALATAHAAEAAPIAPELIAAMRTIAAQQPGGLPRIGVRQRRVFRVFPRGHAARCHRAHAHRIAARRRARAAGGVQSLRAIPWVFAWTQSRHMLPGWFGFGSGLQAALELHGEEVVDAHGGALAVLRPLAR